MEEKRLRLYPWGLQDVKNLRQGSEMGQPLCRVFLTHRGAVFPLLWLGHHCRNDFLQLVNRFSFFLVLSFFFKSEDQSGVEWEGKEKGMKLSF